MPQGRLGVDAGLVAVVGEALPTGEFEMLADLELGDDRRYLRPIVRMRWVEDRVEQFLGGLQQGLALAGEFANGGGAQGGDPVEAGGAQFVADAGLGEQAAVADDHQAGEAEAATQGVELGADGGGIGGVAGEDLDGDGAAVAVAQQGEDDLELAALAVAGMAAGGEGAVGALEVGGGDVGEDEGGVGEMAFGEGLLDGVLAGQEPVHGGVEVVGPGVRHRGSGSGRRGRGSGRWRAWSAAGGLLVRSDGFCEQIARILNYDNRE